MSIYSNVTEKDLDNLRKLAEQQKNERALKIKNRILKQTHDIKLAESLSPTTDRLDEVNKSTKKLGEIVQESITPQLAIKNNQDDSQNILPIENEQIQPGIIYDTTLENTLSKMKKQKGFFNIEERDGEIYWNKIPVEILGDSTIKINNEDVYKISTDLKNVFTDTTEKSLRKLNDVDRVMYQNIVRTLGFDKYIPKQGESKSGRYKHTKNNLDDHVKKTLNRSIQSDSDSDLQGEGLKIIIPSNIIDIYTRLEILLGLKLSGHTDTLTEASNLIDELYKRGEIQKKQQYRNAPNSFHIYLLKNIKVIILEISFQL